MSGSEAAVGGCGGGELEARGRRLLDGTAVYSPAVTAHAVSAMDVALVTRPAVRRPVEDSASSSSPIIADAVELDPGVATLIPTSAQFLREIRAPGFPVYADDVWIVTYPKTGTTWMNEIVYNLMFGGDQDRITEYKRATAPCIRIEILVGVGDSVSRRIDVMNKVKRPRIFVTHLPEHVLPAKIFQTARVITTFRNPKDAAVSYYHFHRMNAVQGTYTGTWENFLKAYVNGELMWGSWLDWHLPMYMKYKDCKNVLIVHFEDMKKDAKAVIKQVSSFLNISGDEALYEQTLVNSGFRNMKADLDSVINKFPMFDLKKSAFFRKGVVGDWKSTFTVAQNEWYDAVLGEALRAVPSLRLRYE